MTRHRIELALAALVALAGVATAAVICQGRANVPLAPGCEDQDRDGDGDGDMDDFGSLQRGDIVIRGRVVDAAGNGIPGVMVTTATP